MSFFKMLFSFAPWICFLAIAHGSLFRLKLGLAVALVVSIIMGVLRLHRGVILWAGLAFFVYATVAVFAFTHMWTVQHMGILANGALALSTWYTVAIGKPFTLDYAREHADPSLWNHPAFIRTNVIMSSVWGVCFTIGMTIAYFKMTNEGARPEWQFEVLNYAFMVSTMFFTTWYPGYVKRQRLAQATAQNQGSVAE